MVGVEFVILYVREPDFWIIRKQKRLDRTTTIPLNDYYIVGANVYQAPRVYDVLASRLLVLTLSIKNSVGLLNTLNEFQIGDVAGQTSTNASGNASSVGSGSGGSGTNTSPATGLSGPNVSPGVLLNPATVGGMRDAMTPGLQLTPMTAANPLTSMQNNTNGIAGESRAAISSLVYDSLLNAVAALAGPVYLDETN